MTIEQLKLAIQEKIGEYPEILFVTKTGGHLFCSNCKDEDYIVVIRSNSLESFKIYDSENNIDYFVKGSYYYKNKLLNFSTKKIENVFAISDLFKPTKCIYGDSTVTLNLLSKEKEYKAMLKELLPKSILHPKIKWKNSDRYCHKHLWWAIIGLKMIDYKSYEITSEMQEIIQKCHDGVLEKSWEEWVKNKLS